MKITSSQKTIRYYIEHNNKSYRRETYNDENNNAVWFVRDLNQNWRILDRQTIMDLEKRFQSLIDN